MPDDFIVHEVVNRTLVRVMYGEQPGVWLDFDFIPATNAFIRPVLEEGPIHMRLSQLHPLCESCREGR